MIEQLHCLRKMSIPKSCCFTGFLEHGEPTGSDEIYAGFACYVSKPEKPGKQAIIIAPDAFGYTLMNTRLIADNFAKRGYLVIMPDIFNGFLISTEMLDPVFGFNLPETKSFFQKFKLTMYRTWCFIKCIPTMFKFMKHEPKSKLPIIAAISTELRKSGYKIGIQGYCFGGSIGILSGATAYVDAVVACHPGQFNVKIDTNALNVPTFFLLAEEDFMLKEKNILIMKEIASKHATEIKIKQFKGTAHGFAVRYDTRHDNQRKKRHLKMQSSFLNLI